MRRVGSDEDLMVRVQAGDSQALATLIDRYRLLEGPIWIALPLTQLLLPAVLAALLARRPTSGPPAAAT